MLSHVRLLVWLSVEIYNLILYLKCLSWKSDAALHIVLATVNRASHNLTELVGILCNVLTSLLIVERIERSLLRTSEIGEVKTVVNNLAADVIAQSVEVGILCLQRHGVARWVVEHHDVVQLHLAKALHAAIVPVRPFDVRLASAEQCRHGVLSKRHGKRSLRNARSVAHLAHKQIVADKQRLFKRR